MYTLQRVFLLSILIYVLFLNLKLQITKRENSLSKNMFFHEIYLMNIKEIKL